MAPHPLFQIVVVGLIFAFILGGSIHVSLFAPDLLGITWLIYAVLLLLIFGGD